MVFFEEIHVFLQLNWIHLFGKTESIFTLTIESCRENTFPKVTQLSQGNNMLDAPASNTDGFLSRDSFLSPTLLNICIWNKMSLSPR
jgi:hypothetical protein